MNGLGWKMTDRDKKIRSDALRGRPQIKVQCPHCGKSGGRPAMKRHHFENCKCA